LELKWVLCSELQESHSEMKVSADIGGEFQIAGIIVRIAVDVRKE
jgi:hypothetical protein